MNIEALQLSQLNREIQAIVQEAFPRLVWLIAEVSEMTVNRNGHCYLELVEIDERSKKVVARLRATIWSYSFHMLKSYFESSTGSPFKAGIKIMVEASVEYHELYGLSLNIKNINPSYTMGNMALQRKAIIEKLKADGVFNMNKELELPFVAQRIAIISSPTAAGLQDFRKQLEHNSMNMHFYCRLFPASMQGEQTAASIILALEDVADLQDEFDLVVIIRGGGAQLDLASFDNYELANHVAQFPLPIITGIGHDKDETIIDLVANLSLKTPTAVADFLIDGATSIFKLIESLSNRLKDSCSYLLNDENEWLMHTHRRLSKTINIAIDKNKLKLNHLSFRNAKACQQFFNQQEAWIEKRIFKLTKEIPIQLNHEFHGLFTRSSRLKNLCASTWHAQETKLKSYEIRQRLTDPKQILKRGYSVIYKNGTLIKSSQQLHAGDEIETHLSSGKIKSIVTTKQNEYGKEEIQL
ncbi:MAG: exodeoxyribonuclease VII large subunit [Mangrovibacterium sp.]